MHKLKTHDLLKIKKLNNKIKKKNQRKAVVAKEEG